jgi:hypothetical protein
MRHRKFSRRAFLLAVWLLVIVLTTACLRRHTSVEEVDLKIRDQVPIGCDKRRVKQFIDNFTVGSLKIGRDSEFHKYTKGSLGTQDREKVAELGEDRIEETIGAVVLQAESDGVMRFKDIGIRFYIDKDGLMIGYTVKLMGSE